MQVVPLAEGSDGDVRMPPFEQTAGVQVVGQGYGLVRSWGRSAQGYAKLRAFVLSTSYVERPARMVV